MACATDLRRAEVILEALRPTCASIYLRRISSICQGSIAGGGPLNAIADARCIVCAVFDGPVRARMRGSSTQQSFFLFYVEHGRKRC